MLCNAHAFKCVSVRKCVFICVSVYEEENESLSCVCVASQIDDLYMQLDCPILKSVAENAKPVLVDTPGTLCITIVHFDMWTLTLFA